MDASDVVIGSSTDTTKGGGGMKPKPAKVIQIVVNETAVSITKGKHTGLEIKQIAIAQGAELELDFVLSVERGKHHVTVADDEIVKVREGMDFLAVAGDDNS